MVTAPVGVESLMWFGGQLGGWRVGPGHDVGSVGAGLCLLSRNSYSHYSIFVFRLGHSFHG